MRSGSTILATPGGGFALFDRSGLLLNVWETDTQYNIVDAAGEFALAASWDTPALRILKRETHPDAQLFSYDGGAPHSEARISADGSVAMLFRYDGFQLRKDTWRSFTTMASFAVTPPKTAGFSTRSMAKRRTKRCTRSFLRIS